MISFGDNVRVRVVAATEAAGIAGLVGQVRGETTPSVTQVDVIGELEADFALNVHFEERGDSHWLAPDLLELVDHAPGTEIRLKGVPKRWVREADGSWQELDAPDPARKPWWRFWR